MIGVHRWLHWRNPESGETYYECERCLLRKDTTPRTDNLGRGGGGGYDGSSYDGSSYGGSSYGGGGYDSGGDGGGGDGGGGD
jgi:hypothetical protein